jgi:hypothetical protein
MLDVELFQLYGGFLQQQIPPPFVNYSQLPLWCILFHLHCWVQTCKTKTHIRFIGVLLNDCLFQNIFAISPGYSICKFNKFFKKSF